MLALLVVVLALGLNNFGAAIAIGVGGLDRLTGLKVAAVFGLWDVMMPAAGLLIGHGLAGELGRAARWTGAGVLVATAVWGLVEAVRGDDDAPQAWHGWRRLLVSGAALSLDDFAVGLALGARAVPVVAAVITFGVFSAVFDPDWTGVGREARFGDRRARRGRGRGPSAGPRHRRRSPRAAPAPRTPPPRASTPPARVPRAQHQARQPGIVRQFGDQDGTENYRGSQQAWHVITSAFPAGHAPQVRAVPDRGSAVPLSHC